MFAYLSSVCGFIFPFGQFIAPLVIWKIKKEEMPMVAEAAKETLNFQITLLLYSLVAVVLMLVGIGFILAVVPYIAGTILTIIAAIKAGNGELYCFPFTLRLVK